MTISLATCSVSYSATLKTLSDALKSPPPTNRRLKLIHAFSDNNAWILHNKFREREIKDSLFYCAELKPRCQKYKDLALNVRPEVKTYLFKNPTLIMGGFVLSFSLGLSLAIFLLK